MGEDRRRSVVAALSAAGAVVVAWLLVVPWDLSEVDAQGHQREGLDDQWVGALAIGIVLVLAAVGLVVGRRTAPLAAPVAFGGLLAFTAMYLWRAGAARTSGANMFLVLVIFPLGPALVALPPVLGRIARWRQDRYAS